MAAIVLLALGISIRIYTQLENATRLDRVLVEAQTQLDQIVSIQLDQETGLRGYLATGDPLFLEPYARGIDASSRALDAFSAGTRGLAIPEVDRSIREIRALHDSWTNHIAKPLLAHPHAQDALEREVFGKSLIDRIRGDTTRVRGLLAYRSDLARAQLRQRIDQALFGGLASVLVFGMLSIVFVSSRVQMLATIDRERAIVETLEGAFRNDLDQLPGARVGTAYLSADRDAAVGGDLYDVRRLDGSRGLVVVADVSGKGIEAAVNTAFVKYTVRTLVRSLRDPAAILNEFNAIFLDTVRDPHLFVVVFVGIIDADAKVLTYASAGHGNAFLRRGDEVRVLEVTGPVIGLDVRFIYESRSVSLLGGDLVLLATDGLTEARNGAGEMLDTDGAIELLHTASLDPRKCADAMVAAVSEMNGGIVNDDLALIAIAIEKTEGTAGTESA